MGSNFHSFQNVFLKISIRPESSIEQDSRAIQYTSETVNDTILKYIKTVSKIVLDWSIYPIETIKIPFKSGLDFTSKIEKSQKTEQVNKNRKN